MWRLDGRRKAESVGRGAAEAMSGGLSFLRKLKGSAAQCESNADCEQPMVCCDLLVARVCCSSGMMVGMPQPSLQQSLIPIRVEKDERFPGARSLPPGAEW